MRFKLTIARHLFRALQTTSALFVIAFCADAQALPQAAVNPSRPAARQGNDSHSGRTGPKTEGPSAWLPAVSRKSLPKLRSSDASSAREFATLYFSEWGRGAINEMVSRYSHDARLLSYKLKKNGTIISGNVAAQRMLTTHWKHTWRNTDRVMPKISIVEGVTYGQIFVLLTLTLNLNALDRLNAGKYQISGRVAVLNIKRGSKDFILLLVRDGSEWRALEQPYSLEFPTGLVSH